MGALCHLCVLPSHGVSRLSSMFRSRQPGPRHLVKAGAASVWGLGRESADGGEHCRSPVQVGHCWGACVCRCLLCVRREEYRLLSRMGAGRVEAVLDPMFREPQTWEALSVLGVFDSATPSSS